MSVNEIKDLKPEFMGLVAIVDSLHNKVLLEELKRINKRLDKYDSKSKNAVQSVGRLLTIDIKKRIQSYIDDIFDNYDKYLDDDKEFVQKELKALAIKYSPNDRTFLDKFKSVIKHT